MSWHLQSRESSYAGHIEPGLGPVLDFWGARVDSIDRRWAPPTLPLAFVTMPDLAPLESSNGGDRQGLASDLDLEYACGVVGTVWRDCTVQPVVHGCEVTAIDETYTLRRTDRTTMNPSTGVLSRSVELGNTGTDAVAVSRMMSSCWNIWAPYGVIVQHFSGGWSEEFSRIQTQLSRGSLHLGSRQGFTGHLHAPWVILIPLGADGHADPEAGAYGVSLAWSGSWTIEVEVPTHGGHARVRAGMSPTGGRIDLGGGESFRTPECLGVFSADGPSGVSSAWHAHHRQRSDRNTDLRHRPVVYNSWYVSAFDVRTDHQLQLADLAKDLGVEVFVVDDGWFTGRDDDTGGLGDWLVDEVALPGGLGPLVAGVLGRGLRFGIWIEPEAVSADSRLFAEHPDWIYRAGDRPLTSIRHQYVLDLGRPEVVTHLCGVLRRLLGAQLISYLKWDMNRPVTDGGRPGRAGDHRWAVDHVLGYYQILTMLRTEFPDVTVEACAGGGGRIDWGVIGLTDVVWPSDETGPRDRLQIQDGFLALLPPAVMCGWVTDEVGTRDRCPTSLEFRFLVSMTGVLGIGADIVSWDPETRLRAAELIRQYLDIRPVVLGGEVHVHGRPGQRGYAIEYGPTCPATEPIVIMVWDTVRERLGGAPIDRLHPAVRLRPRSADPRRIYRLRASGDVITGRWLLAAGLDVPWQLAADCDLVILDPIAPDPTPVEYATA